MMPTNRAESDKLQNWLLGSLVVAFLILSLCYSFAIPIFEAQDEKAHFEFIRFVATRTKLPDFRDSDELNAAGVQSIQTPLYYVVQGALLRISGRENIRFEYQRNPFRSKSSPAMYYHNHEGEKFPYKGQYRVFHLMRLTNIVAGILILLILYKTTSLLISTESLLPVAATGFVALIPQFVYICATMSNDAFSVLFASLSFYFLLRILLSASVSLMHVAAMSVSIALAILSKQMTLYLVPVCYTAVLIKGDFQQKARNIFVMTAGLALLAGWYYARNWLFFGDVFNLQAQAEKLSPLLVERKTLEQFLIYFPAVFVPRFIKSFWGSFGYTSAWMSWTTYLFYNVLAGLGLTAYAVGLLDPNFRNGLLKAKKIVLAFLVLAPAILFAEILLFNFSMSQPQGRYAFSGLCCLAIFWGLGMDRVVNGSRAHRNLFFLFLTLLFVLVNVHVLRSVVQKAFSPPPGKIDVIQTEGESHLLTLDRNNVVGQTFHSTINDLDQIAVKFHARGNYRNCHVIFRLKDAAEPRGNLANIKVPGSVIRDNAYHFFKFPALNNSKGKTYLFLIEGIDERGVAGISCFHTEDDAYKGGMALLNGKPLSIDLTFSTGRT